VGRQYVVLGRPGGKDFLGTWASGAGGCLQGRRATASRRRQPHGPPESHGRRPVSDAVAPTSRAIRST